MAITLISKIEPKNSAFVGMVDSDQVLSAGVSGNLVSFGDPVLEDSGIAITDGFITTPEFAPTVDYQVANKKYVDDSIGASGASSFLMLDQTTPQTVHSGQTIFSSGVALGNDTSEEQDIFRILDGTSELENPVFQWRPNYEQSGYGGFSFYAKESTSNVCLPCIGNSDVAIAAFTTNPDKVSSIVLYDNNTGDIGDARYWSLSKNGQFSDLNKNSFSIGYADLSNFVVFYSMVFRTDRTTLINYDFIPYASGIARIGTEESAFASGVFDELKVTSTPLVGNDVANKDYIDALIVASGSANSLLLNQSVGQIVDYGQATFASGVKLGANSPNTQEIFRILDGTGEDSEPVFQWRPAYEGSDYGGFSFYSPGSENNVALPCIGNANVTMASFTTDPDSDSSMLLYDNNTGDSSDARFWAFQKNGAASDELKNSLSVSFTDPINGQIPALIVSTLGKKQWLSAMNGTYDSDEVVDSYISIMAKTGIGSWTDLKRNVVISGLNAPGPNYLMKLQRNAIDKLSVGEHGDVSASGYILSRGDIYSLASGLFQDISVTSIDASGSIDMNSNHIVSLADPVNDQDAATKAYVDSQISGENVWDRTGTQITTHTPNDSVRIDGDLYVNASGIFQNVSATSIVASGNLTVDTDTLFVDGVNNMVGFGTVAPSGMIDVETPINRLAYMNRTLQTFDYMQHCVAPSTYTNDTLLASPGGYTVTADVLNVLSDSFFVGKRDKFSDIYFDFGTIMSAGTSRRWEYSAALAESAVVTCSVATTVLTVTAVTSGALHLGDTATINGVERTITAYVTGTGGTGTYTLSPTSGTFGPTTATFSGTWKTLTLNSDGTNQWQNDGAVNFTAPEDWELATVNSQGPFYWLRIGTISGTFTVEPTLIYCIPSSQPLNNMVEIYSGNNGTPDFVMDEMGRVALGYADPSTYKLRVYGTGYFSSTLSIGGTTTCAAITASSTITNTLSTAGYTHVGGLILNGPAGTALLPSMNSPVTRYSAQAWNGFITNINAMDIYNNPNADPITNARLCFKNTTTDGYANATEIMNITTDGNVNILGQAQSQEDTFDRIFHFVSPSTYTDDTNACQTIGVLTGDVLNVYADYFYIGKRNTFTGAYFEFGTIMSDGTTRTWQYWNGSTWTAIPDLVDNTDSWNNNGTISFTAPADWAKTTVGATTAQCGPIYWIRVGTAGTGTFTVEPTLRFCVPMQTPNLLSNGWFIGNTGWSTTGDFAYNSNNFIFTYSGGSGTLKQAKEDFAIAAKPNTWYRFRYVLGVAGPATGRCYIGDEFADGKTYFQSTSTTEVDVYFKSNNDPGDFIIYATDTATSGMRIDALELIEMNTGNLSVTGRITGAGRGSKGMEIDHLGNVGFDCVPSGSISERIMVAGNVVPNASGTWQVGTRTNPFASGVFDYAKIVGDADIDGYITAASGTLGYTTRIGDSPTSGLTINKMHLTDGIFGLLGVSTTHLESVIEDSYFNGVSVNNGLMIVGDGITDTNIIHTTPGYGAFSINGYNPEKGTFTNWRMGGLGEDLGYSVYSTIADISRTQWTNAEESYMDFKLYGDFPTGQNIPQIIASGNGSQTAIVIPQMATNSLFLFAEDSTLADSSFSLLSYDVNEEKFGSWNGWRITGFDQFEVEGPAASGQFHNLDLIHGGLLSRGKIGETGHARFIGRKYARNTPGIDLGKDFVVGEIVAKTLDNSFLHPLGDLRIRMHDPSGVTPTADVMICSVASGVYIPQITFGTDTNYFTYDEWDYGAGKMPMLVPTSSWAGADTGAFANALHVAAIDAGTAAITVSDSTFTNYGQMVMDVSSGLLSIKHQSDTSIAVALDKEVFIGQYSDDTYWRIFTADFGIGGKMPVLKASGSFFAGPSIGAIADYLVLWDQSNIGAPTIALVSNDLGSSATIAFDPSNARLHVSDADLRVDGNIEPNTDDEFYVGRNDDDDPMAWKGIILKDQAGTGKYYRLEVYNDALRIVDLSD